MKKIFAVFILFILSANAQGELDEVLSRNSYEPNYVGMLLGLFVVIGLVYLTGIIYKKLIGIKICAPNENDKYSIQIVSSASLGQNKNLIIVKVNSKYTLIGATQNSITFIKDIGEDNEN
ncbi:MAG: flagellar biosynthetic protein FliO [Candidatus Gastranaerophilales bacterium]|nr:flagellar biosynthetic protein FliO [Candidatus Gastranaerophilales bacterium]